ncbi:MAG: EamA family transporter [Nanoarchaeota archaeon]|nr:EamA family transporter [Nanoarchaeota archaeon]
MSKKSKAVERGDKTKTILLVIASVIIISTAQVLMKNGMSMIDIPGIGSLLNLYYLIQIGTNPYVVGGLLMYGFALILWLGAMSRADVSFILPLLSTGYILTTIFAMLFLHEQVTILRWVGVSFIFAGSFFVGGS